MSTVVRSKKRYTIFSNRALAVLIIPIVIESAFTMSLGLADSFMVQSVGENGTAMSAVSNVDQILRGIFHGCNARRAEFHTLHAAHSHD